MKKLPYDKVLFVGSFAHGAFLDELFSKKVYSQYAANTVEKYYIDGLIEEMGLDIDIISALVTVPYPKNKHKIVQANETQYKNTKIVNVGFPNFPYINQMAQGRRMKKYARQWAAAHKHEKVLVVVYALRVAFLETAKQIKKRIPGATVINIVPDMPQYMHGKMSFLRRLLISMNQRMIDQLRTCVDGYVLYTKPMAEALHLQEKPWTVIEGIYDPMKCRDIEQEQTVPDKDKLIFMYAGGVSENYGLKLLVEGFLAAQIPNAELHIYGNGEFAGQLREYERSNPAVHYFGAVSPDVAQKKMRQAHVLVNPRPSNNVFTKFSCPSKVIEYMATGRAVLMTRLEGIPDAYFDYVYTIDDESVEGVAAAMKRVAADGEEARAGKGALAREYIHKQKNITQQMQKVIALLDDIECRRKQHA